MIKLSISQEFNNTSFKTIINTLILLLSSIFVTARSMPLTSIDTTTTSNQFNEFQAINQPKSIGQYQFTRNKDQYMQLHLIKNSTDLDGNNVTCNDGSPIGYYKRLNNHSKSWIIFLQGGGFCSSEETCRLRWQQTPHLMSSNFWAKTKLVDGILSSELKDNPYLWNANHIYVPYCSSDSWSGLTESIQQTTTRRITTTTTLSSISFMGSKIIERVIESLYEDLPRDSSLHEAKFILLAGNSAGAVGVILNLDKVNRIIEQKSASNYNESKINSSNNNCIVDQNNNCEQHQKQYSKPVLRGLADSGWFLDNEPYFENKNYDQSNLNSGTSGIYKQIRQQLTKHRIDDNLPLSSPIMANDLTDCDQTRCTSLQLIKQSMHIWNGQIPRACYEQYSTEPWRCYFAYRAYQTLKTPLFVVQWLYDDVQLMSNNIIIPFMNSNQLNYVNKFANEMRASLENVTALFLPSCSSHSLINKSSWNQININGFKLPQLLNSWEEQSLLDTTISLTKTTPNSAIISSNDYIQKNNNYSLNTNKNINSNQQPRFEALVMEQQEHQPNYYQNIEPKQSQQEEQNYQSQMLESTASNLVRLPTNVNLYKDLSSSSSNQELSKQLISKQNQVQTQSQTNNNNRSRNRKRRRNNQNHSKTKQSRQKQQLSSTSTTNESSHQIPITASTNLDSSNTNEQQQKFSPGKDSNDLSSSINPMQDLYPLLDRSLSSTDILYAKPTSGRLSRSTVVDDGTIMLTNNYVPDDGTLSSPEVQQHSSYYSKYLWPIGIDSLARGVGISNANYIITNSYPIINGFRLFDSCSWPQCNRDCPNFESE